MNIFYKLEIIKKEAVVTKNKIFYFEPNAVVYAKEVDYCYGVFVYNEFSMLSTKNLRKPKETK